MLILMFSTKNLWAFSLLGTSQKSLHAQPFRDLLVLVLYIFVKYGELVKARQANLHREKGNTGEFPNVKYMSGLSIVSANKHSFILVHISYSLNSVEH